MPGNALLDLDDAVAALRGRLAPIAEVERVAVRAARGRWLARAVHAPHAVPGFANSAMDGYAVATATLGASEPIALRVIGHSRAGHPCTLTPGAGECVRIATGAAMPAGADAVVMQEDTAPIADGVIGVRVRPDPGQWVRGAGHDFPAGALVVPAATRLEARHVGVLAAAGVGSVDVVRRARVHVLSTGDELREPGEPLADGEIHDSNRYTLLSLLEDAGAIAEDGGRVGDDAAAVRTALTDAARGGADLILTSGGVSVGDPDFVGRVIASEGAVEFWRLAVKPGKPLLFARFADRFVIGLPGNPVSTFVTFLTVVRPAIARLMGADWQPPLTLRARLAHPIAKDPGRLEFQRGVLRGGGDDDGMPIVANTGNQSSGMLSSVCAANCFIVLPRASGSLPAGASVAVMPFRGCL